MPTGPHRRPASSLDGACVRPDSNLKDLRGEMYGTGDCGLRAMERQGQLRTSVASGEGS
jgi:hypothetical protein